MKSAVFTAACCCLCMVAAAAEVPWLSDVQRDPKLIPAPFRILSPLLPAESFAAADALDRWKIRRVELITTWKTRLGPMPERPRSTAIEVLRTDQLDGLTRKLIRYENEPGQTMDAYLLQPTSHLPRGKRAGLVALHATTDDTIEPIAGVVGPESDQLGLKLARLGFVVICPRNFLWHQVQNFDEAVNTFQQRHPGTLGMHKMLFDAQRAADILATLPDVDPQRLGTVGHSLGAKEVLYLMAFDERIHAGVFSEGGIAFNSTNWNAPWYLGPGVEKDDFPGNHHELIALIAPRPFLVLGGETGPGAADGDRSWPYLKAAWPIYELYGKPARLGLLNHGEGHSISPKIFDRLAEWLLVSLSGN